MELLAIETTFRLDIASMIKNAHLLNVIRGRAGGYVCLPSHFDFEETTHKGKRTHLL